MELKNSRSSGRAGLEPSELTERTETNVPPGKMELKNSRSSGRAGLEP